MSLAFGIAQLRGSVFIRIFVGFAPSLPLLRFSASGGSLDAWPMVPQRLVGAERHPPGSQLLIPARPGNGSQFLQNRLRIRRADPQVIRDFQIRARQRIEGEGIAPLAVIMGGSRSPLLCQPALDASRRGLSGHEPAAELVAPPGARECLPKPLHRRSIIREARFGTGSRLRWGNVGGSFHQLAIGSLFAKQRPSRHLGSSRTPQEGNRMRG